MDFTWWYQNTTQLMDSDPRLSIQSMTVEINNGFLDTNSTLTIPSVDRADAGDYTCVASNTVFGSLMQDVQQFMLTVNCKCLTDICQCYFFFPTREKLSPELSPMACISCLHCHCAECCSTRCLPSLFHPRQQLKHWMLLCACIWGWSHVW